MICNNKPLLFSAAFLLCSLLWRPAHAQQQLPRHAFQLSGGYSSHGSGDLRGIAWGTGYTRYHSRKLSLNYELRAHIHHGEHTYLVNDVNTGRVTDASIRFTTAGVQLGVNGQYSMVRNKYHEFLVSLGAFGRFQSASNGSDGYNVYKPHLTGVPTILIGYDNRTPQNTAAFGGLFQLHYNITFSKQLYLGLAPGFQTDTNGDALPQAVLVVGKRL